MQINTISGYENVKDYYFIIDNGDVETRLLKPMLNHKGYFHVDLQTINGSKKSVLVHRLVALAFIGNLDFDIYNQVNHKDGNKENNWFWNLEWSDNKYNSEHAQELGNWDHDHYPKPIIATNIRTGRIVYFPSITQAAIWIGNVDNRSNIRKCLNNKISSAYGYAWKYRDEMERYHV